MESETETPELSAGFVFHCPGFQHDGPLVSSLALGFLHVPLLPRELSPSCAPVVLGFLLVRAMLRLFQPG